MDFWKKHSYQIVRLFVIQIGIAIFGLVLSFAVATAFRDRSDRLPLLMVSIFSVLFYLFLLYSVSWEIGGKDRLRLDAIHAEFKNGTGFLLALCHQSLQPRPHLFRRYRTAFLSFERLRPEDCYTSL